LSTLITNILISRSFIKCKVDKFHAIRATKAWKGSTSIFPPPGPTWVWVYDILKQIKMKKPLLMLIKHAAINETWNFIVTNL
jgi:hypothetical protein